MRDKATAFQWAFTAVMYGLGALVLAAALWPAALFFEALWQAVRPESAFARAGCAALGAGVGYFIFGLSLCAVTVALRLVFSLRLREGEYPFFSIDGVRWAFVNAMVLIVNITFMDFMRLTPLLPLYFRLMGARIGRRVQINTKGVADLSMLEIGDDTVLGGDAVLIGHLAEHGKLKLKKTVIGRRVTIGLGAVILPGASIGDGALIAARSVLSKNAQVPPRTLFAGTPAQLIKTLDA